MLRKQLTEVLVVAMLVLGGGKAHHSIAECSVQGMMRGASSITVGQGGSSLLSVSRQDAPHLPLGHMQQLCRSLHCQLPCYHQVEHLQSVLVFAVQDNVSFSHTDIFSYQLDPDIFLSHQHLI
jgi:hypothetical protein